MTVSSLLQRRAEDKQLLAACEAAIEYLERTMKRSNRKQQIIGMLSQAVSKVKARKETAA